MQGSRLIVEILSLALFINLTGSSAAEDKETAPKANDHIFKIDFESSAEKSSWTMTPGAKWTVAGDKGAALEVALQKRGTEVARKQVDLKPYRGCRVFLKAKFRSENVSRPAQPWNGVKYTLHYKTPSSSYWANENGIFGTHDWSDLGFMASIADDADQGEILLGLEDCSGSVMFKDLEATVIYKPISRNIPEKAGLAPFKGHSLQRLRGAMSPFIFRDEDLRVFGQEWNANLIRWQLNSQGNNRDMDYYERWLSFKLDELDKVLDACGKYKIKAVVDLHTPPGGRTQKGMTMLTDKAFQDKFVEVWQKIAKRYKGRKEIWAYDLANEPLQSAPPPLGALDYLGVQERAARAIREIDAQVPIIVAADQMDKPIAFSYMKTIDVPNVIYQVHMYDPGEYTCQGIYFDRVNIPYPGKIGDVYYDKEALRKILDPVRKFQLANNVHIYVGEFSTARWAPGSVNYLRDCIEIFEEYGWDWSYHAFRESDYFSVELNSDKKDLKPVSEPTDRMKLLLEWFKKNQKP